MLSDTRSAALPAAIQHKNLLFDFYGVMLTEKQRIFFTMHYMEDMSLAEIGEQCGVTPQAVADLLKRANTLLDGYEQSMGLVKKLAAQKDAARQIHVSLDVIARVGQEADIPGLLPLVEQLRVLTCEMIL